jgi:hypothetical protein
MQHEHNGSKPGLIHNDSHLSRVNTFPSVEFSIPPSDPPARNISKCSSHRPRSSGSPAENPDTNEKRSVPGDEEAQSDAVFTDGDDESYPEGGLAAWLVVLGSFFGTIVSFGMM